MSNYITDDLKQHVKSIIKGLPKQKAWDDDEYFPTYELMVYATYEEGKYDFDEFYGFKGIRELDKAVSAIISKYNETLYCIDFKYSYEEGEFDQFTIYEHPRQKALIDIIDLTNEPNILKDK
jgi:hypothetical protein